MTDRLIDPRGTPAARELDLRRQYLTTVTAQTVRRGGSTVPLDRLRPELESPERRRRERAWRSYSRRRMEDARALSDVWDSLVGIRTETTPDSGKQTYPVLRSSEATELSLGHEDRQRAQLAVEEFVTSVLVRLHERRRLQLGLRTIRPWDLYAAPPGLPTDPVFETKVEAVAAIETALQDVQYSGHLVNMPIGPSHPLQSDEEVEGFLADYGVALAHTGVRDGAPGHRYVNEVAAVALPLLVLHGTADTKEGQSAPCSLHRARIRHLERFLLRWTFGAMTDAFEGWAYSRTTAAQDGAAAGAVWSSLWLRFLPAVDWAGLEEELRVEWQRHDALFLTPGESVPRMWWEMETVRTWSLSTEHRAWFGDLGVFGQGVAGQVLNVTPISDQDVLDVARWIEDAIEELEGSR